MSNAEAFGKLLSGVFSRFEGAAEKAPALGKIAAELAKQSGTSDKNAVNDFTNALVRLVADGKISPEGLTADAATLAIQSLLASAGQKVPPLSAAALKYINNSFDKCGGCDAAITKPPAGGPPIQTLDGKHVVVYCVEDEGDSEKTPKLPAVRENKESTTGNPFLAASMLRTAFQMWELKVKVSIIATEDPTKANLIVTGRPFGADIPNSVLALTDIGPGPSWGSQLRMVFDTAETPPLTQFEFLATAAHEFGHAMGIRHADVPESNQLMSPMLSEIAQPQQGDLRAAVGKGWALKS